MARVFGIMRYMDKTEQLEIPKKTRIAAWIILGVSIFGFLGTAVFYFYYMPKTLPIPPSVFLALIMLLIPYLFRFLIGFFLLKGKKIAWWLATIFLLLGLVFNLFPSRITENFPYLLPIAVILNLIPLLLLFTDRKNFFIIAD